MKNLLLVLLLFLVSCSTTTYDEEFVISDARVVFTYTVPEEIFKYAELTVCYNNDEGTNAEWEPVLDNSITVTYNLNKFPIVVPAVMVYKTTNRPAYGIDVDWNIIMEANVILTVNGQEKVYSYLDIYKIDGDLGVEINSLINNVKDRTFGVKILKNGEVKWIKSE